jgi:ATP adenylyltransferase
MPERLWAPWRLGFILGPKPEGCFLCQKPGEQRDAENYVLERGSTCFVILNAYPYNNGHLLISPYRHTGDFGVLTTEELNELMSLTQRWVQRLQERMRPEGFNIGFNVGKAAGAGVAEHLHQHIVPRWSGDTNFMSTVSDMRVINQSLDELYALLK